jgi:hypothetical protein
METFMKTLTRTALAATFVAGLALPLAAKADDTTVIKETPGTYSETHEGRDGQYKIQQNGVNTKSAYKGDGVQMKSSSNGVVTKEKHQAGDCKGSSVTNDATGKSVTKENCD